jgi:hypothetical protein
MAATPAGPPAKDVTAMDWSDVTRFADDVKQLLDGLTAIAPGLNNQNAFTVMAGSFVDAKSLATAAASVGSSTQAEVVWLQRLLGDVESGLTNAVKTLSKNESLQQAGAQKMLSQLQNINTDLGSPPSGGTGSGSTPSPSPSPTTTTA